MPPPIFAQCSTPTGPIYTPPLVSQKYTFALGLGWVLGAGGWGLGHELRNTGSRNNGSRRPTGWLPMTKQRGDAFGSAAMADLQDSIKSQSMLFRQLRAETSRLQDARRRAPSVPVGSIVSMNVSW